MKNSQKTIIATVFTGLGLIALGSYAVADGHKDKDGHELVSQLAISQSKAVEIALGNTAGTVLGSDLDHDKKSVHWEVDIVDSNSEEFEIQVDANTGDILSSEADGKSDWDLSVITALPVSQSQAIEIALQDVPGTVLGSELDEEGSTMVWQVEIADSNSAEFEVEIDANTGDIISSKADD